MYSQAWGDFLGHRVAILVAYLQGIRKLGVIFKAQKKLYLSQNPQKWQKTSQFSTINNLFVQSIYFETYKNLSHLTEKAKLKNL